MTVPSGRRTALERQRAAERAAHAAEVAALKQRIDELESSNDALGKAIGLLHQLSEHEPDVSQATTDPSGS